MSLNKLSETECLKEELTDGLWEILFWIYYLFIYCLLIDPKRSI